MNRSEVSSFETNVLIRQINLSAKEARLPRFILPAENSLQREAVVVRREVRALEETHGTEAKTLAACAGECAGTQNNLRATRARLEQELKQSLPLEEKGIQKALKLVQEKLKALAVTIKEQEKKLSNPIEAAVRLKRVLELRQENIRTILKVYPDAQILDLSCLAYFNTRQGLPALTLFSLTTGTSALNFSTEGLQLHTCKLDLPKAVVKTLSTNVQAATGVFVSGSSRPASCREWSGVARKNNVSLNDKHRFRGLAWRMRLSTDFSEGGRVIPEASRKVIKQALDSKLFDEVLLLAEVKKWRVSYIDYQSYDDRRPRIPGEHRRSKDPLVLGIKKIANQTVAVLIHAFNTTPLESFVERSGTTSLDPRATPNTSN